ELATCVKYRLNIKIIVIKNDSLGQIKWEQMVFLGNPEYACDLQPIDFTAVAKGFGAEGVRIDRPDHCADQLAHALALAGPVVIEAIVDPHEPPMPPKASLAQAAKLTEALLRGSPDAVTIARRIGKDVVREIV